MEMKKRILILTVLIVVCSLHAYAINRTWTNFNESRLWREAGNWSGVEVPLAEDNVLIYDDPNGPFIEYGTSAYCNDLLIPHNDPCCAGILQEANLTIWGGSIRTNGKITIGRNPGTSGIVTLENPNGLLEMSKDGGGLIVGGDGAGTLIVNSGTIRFDGNSTPGVQIGGSLPSFPSDVSESNGVMIINGGSVDLGDDLFRIGTGRDSVTLIGKGKGHLIINNGELKTGNATVVGFNSCNGKITMNGGVFLNGGNLQLGNTNGNAELIMNGGDLECTSGWLVVGVDDGSTAHVQLNAGQINVSGSFNMKALGTMDIREGVLRINGNIAASINSFVNSGQITAYNGYGTVNVEFVSANDPAVPNAGTTIVTATPNPVCQNGVYLDGDVDQNCIVNMTDMAKLANNWLQCNNGDGSCL